MTQFWLRHQSTSFPVKRGPYLLGRSPSCWLVLSAQRISREHARIRIKRGRLSIEDLGSRNGTRVNGLAITGPTELEHGDVIQLGSEEITVIETEQVASSDGAQEYNTLSDIELSANETMDEPAGRAQRHVLELAEELLLRGSRCEQRDAIGQTICSMVDALVSDIERAGNRLTPGESVRLVSVSQIAAQWAEAPELRDWSAELVRTLSPSQ